MLRNYVLLLFLFMVQSKQILELTCCTCIFNRPVYIIVHLEGMGARSCKY